ncbi:hypothetical protein SRS16CHR_00072 [Variovorax sp. SRS16]|uniref:DUF3311 domain-containing protein n=1 Tax=Variovorax sp. SRS16 TaxID=282217 RepID=UPI001317B292|nr:DUF3311 domain-containing protein [Variovorax sp. SRS16]VTU12833.1 hypothetical protein SRS16CHR_00072 [Variovorax sp. SRS16]
MKAIYGLAVIPFIGFLSGGAILSKVDPLFLGLPFLMVWNIAWMFISSGILAVIYWFDSHAEDAQQ